MSPLAHGPSPQPDAATTTSSMRQGELEIWADMLYVHAALSAPLAMETGAGAALALLAWWLDDWRNMGQGSGDAAAATAIAAGRERSTRRAMLMGWDTREYRMRKCSG